MLTHGWLGSEVLLLGILVSLYINKTCRYWISETLQPPNVQ